MAMTTTTFCIAKGAGRCSHLQKKTGNGEVENRKSVRFGGGRGDAGGT